MNGLGVFFIILVVLLIGAAAGWVIFTQLRARRLGVCAFPSIICHLSCCFPVRRTAHSSISIPMRRRLQLRPRPCSNIALDDSSQRQPSPRTTPSHGRSRRRTVSPRQHLAEYEDGSMISSMETGIARPSAPTRGRTTEVTLRAVAGSGPWIPMRRGTHA